MRVFKLLAEMTRESILKGDVDSEGRYIRKGSGKKVNTLKNDFKYSLSNIFDFFW